MRPNGYPRRRNRTKRVRYATPMNRRDFISTSTAGQAAAASVTAQTTGDAYQFSSDGGLVIERAATGKPRAGQVVAAIQPHSDDITILAAGLLFKMMDEGAKAYLIRVTNDDMAGPGTVANTVLENEKDHVAITRAMGFEREFSLNYGNHMMDAASKSELRTRLIFLFRLLKVDTIVTYDPWGHYEENPDHYVTSQCVEAAAWMAAGDKDLPEHFAAGVHPHAVREKYYFARFDQRVNRVVDTTASVERKIDALLLNKAQGPAGEAGSRLKASLAARGLKLPILGNDNHTANREYIRQFVLRRDRETGQRHGLAYAEKYHHIAPPMDHVADYVKRNAVPL